MCIRQEQLPYVRLISSSSKTSGYTHTIYISAASDLLQQLAIPGYERMLMPAICMCCNCVQKLC